MCSTSQSVSVFLNKMFPGYALRFLAFIILSEKFQDFLNSILDLLKEKLRFAFCLPVLAVCTERNKT